MAKEGASDALRGQLELVLLSALADGAKYGYLISQRLHQASDGAVRLAAGTLYPLLHRLEDARLVRARWESSTGRPRKWYELTAKGQKRLAHRAREWRRLAGVVEKLLEPLPRLDLKPASS
jgi:DNA-binding PadR family transcriptional regulator